LGCKKRENRPKIGGQLPEGSPGNQKPIKVKNQSWVGGVGKTIKEKGNQECRKEVKKQDARGETGIPRYAYSVGLGGHTKIFPLGAKDGPKG